MSFQAALSSFRKQFNGAIIGSFVLDKHGNFVEEECAEFAEPNMADRLQSQLTDMYVALRPFTRHPAVAEHDLLLRFDNTLFYCRVIRANTQMPSRHRGSGAPLRPPVPHSGFLVLVAESNVLITNVRVMSTNYLLPRLHSLLEARSKALGGD